MTFKIIDLTQPIHERAPHWSGESGCKTIIKADYPDFGARVMALELMASIGTHLDAPSHFIQGGKDIHQLQVDELVAPLNVIDVREKAHSDYFISLDDILAYEKQHGEIAPGNVVCGLTGWTQYWETPEKYRSADEKGNIHVPGFSKELGPWFLERNIRGLGIDTFSPDGSDMEFPLHHILLGAGKYIIENLTNLELVPSKGAFLFTFPLKIEGASESPVRAIALINKT